MYPSVKIHARGSELRIRGSQSDVEMVRERIMDMIRGRWDPLETPMDDYEEELPEDGTIITFKKRIKPLTPHQLEYVRAIDESDVVFAIGPAGTGKTFLAVAMAVKYLREGRVERIVLTRPAVEAGESLGYLPGSYEEKVYPYLIPLYDALYSMIPYERVRRMMEARVVEIAPLAYMRGRTLSDAFIILDEAQNTKTVQMKMFLTRIGPRSKVVITGDITQIDLPKHMESGLVEAERILKGIDGISFIYFTKEDVSRHHIVKRIIEAYDKFGK
ncbi:MAG: PhoH family protein [Thermotogae bacterium]|nr:PhoH family protein [Thermotogota bacterium]